MNLLGLIPLIIGLIGAGVPLAFPSYFEAIKFVYSVLGVALLVASGIIILIY